MPKHYYIAPWEWVDTTADQDPEKWEIGWVPPHRQFHLGGFDFRSSAQRAQKGGTPGYALFVYDRAVTFGGSELYLGTDLQGTLSGVQRSGFGVLVGKTPTENDPLMAMNQLLRDPAYYVADNQLAGVGPLKVGASGRIGMWLAGDRIINARADAGARDATIAVFKEAFRRRIAEGADDVSLKKMVGSYCLKLFRQLSDEYANGILPTEYQGFGWLHPATPLTDNFGDGAMTGWSAPGSGSYQDNSGSSWAENVNSNDEDGMRYDTDLSGDDHYCEGQVDCIINKAGGLAVRMSSSAETYYAGGKNQSTTYYIWEVNSGTRTEHANGTGGAAANRVRVEVGNTGADDIEVFESETTSRVTYTDTATLLTGNVRCGLDARFGGGAVRSRIDTWEADVLTAGGLTGIRNPLGGPMRLRQPLGA